MQPQFEGQLIDAVREFLKNCTAREFVTAAGLSLSDIDGILDPAQIKGAQFSVADYAMTTTTTLDVIVSGSQIRRFEFSDGQWRMR